MSHGKAVEQKPSAQHAAAASAWRRVLVILGFIFVACGLAWRENYRERAALAERGLPSPDEMARIVPNSHHLWISRNVLLCNPNGGINADAYRFCWFGWQAEELGNLTKDPKNAWQKICHADADKDGVSNGEEMGDPCCTWSYDQPKAYRIWDLSHPGNDDDPKRNTDTSGVVHSQGKPVDCDAPWTEEDEKRREDQFQNFYFESFGSDTHSDDALFLLKLPLLAVIIFKLYQWGRYGGLLRDLVGVGPHAPASEGPDLTKFERAIIAVLAFCWTDTLAGLTHLCFDYTPHYFPIIGGVAKGFQHHHHHPTGWVVVNFWTMMSHGLPLLGSLSMVMLFVKPRRTYRLFWAVAYQLCFATTLSHRWAHFHPEELPFWYRALQGAGFFMSHKHHMEHHTSPDSQFSNLSGKTDFIIDLIVKHVIPAWDYHLWISFTLLYMFAPIAFGSAAFGGSQVHYKKTDSMNHPVDMEKATE